MKGEMGEGALGPRAAQGAEVSIPGQRKAGHPLFTSGCTSLLVSALGLPWVEMGVPYSFSLEVPGMCWFLK